ncbi:MAG: hypothetical protein WCT47_01400 [Betaproteobacteria bacterium]
MLDEIRDQVASGPNPCGQGQHPQSDMSDGGRATPPNPRSAQRMFLLQAQWLEETLLNARRILGAQDPFLQALQSQRDGAPQG